MQFLICNTAVLLAGILALFLGSEQNGSARDSTLGKQGKTGGKQGQPDLRDFFALRVEENRAVQRVPHSAG